MNKLRVLSLGGGVFVVAAALWAAGHYNTPLRFVRAALIGVISAGLPRGLAHLRWLIASLRRRLADVDERPSAEQGSIFVSKESVDDPLEFLETVRSTLRVKDIYDTVERTAFEEGPGLSVVHDGFHSSFIRITDAGRVAVTGASSRTEDLADLVSNARSLTFERTRDNPFKGAEPVRGAPRVFLSVLVLTGLVVGVNAIGATAYTGDAYNPMERTVLVSIDAKGDLDPAVSETDTQLTKAAFLTTVVEEGETEVRWTGNNTERAVEQGRQALTASRDARELLTTIRAGSPSAGQLERADRIERRLTDAERSVADVLADRAESGDTDGATLRRISDRLRTSADASA